MTYEELIVHERERIKELESEIARLKAHIEELKKRIEETKNVEPEDERGISINRKLMSFSER